MSDVDMRDSGFARLVGDTPMGTRASGLRVTEGPAWQAGTQLLIFNDIPDDCLYCFNPADKTVEVYRASGNKANGNVFDHQHRLATCEHATSRVVREEADGSSIVIASHYDGLGLNSPNDIVVNRGGRLYLTDPPYGRYAGGGVLLGVGVPRKQQKKVQGVYRVDPSTGAIVRLVDDFD